MKELIIIETTQSQRIKKLLEKEQVSFKVYQEPTEKNEKLRQQLIKGYQAVAKSKKRRSEDEI